MRTSPGGISGSDCARTEGNKHISATVKSSRLFAVDLSGVGIFRVQRGEEKGIIAKLLKLENEPVTAQPVLFLNDPFAKDGQTVRFGTAVKIADCIR
jgi:hypothetical protein